MNPKQLVLVLLAWGVAMPGLLGLQGCANAEVGDECVGVGRKFCGDDCVNILTNVEHCGSCDKVCESGQLCCEGACVTPGRDNCGSCGNVCGTGQYCASNVCEACDLNDHCGPDCLACTVPTPYCMGGKCRECAMDAHCGAGKFCEEGICTPCTVDGHCGMTCKSCPAGTFCDGSECKVCSTNSDCPTGKYCTGGECKPCVTHEFCGPGCETCTGTAKPYCNASGTACAECGNSTHCPAGKYCDGGTCTACTTADHCGPLCASCVGTATPFCSSSGCAECLKDSHCKVGERCGIGACVPCNTDDYCGATCSKCSGTPTPYCNTAGTGCVECNTDAHCNQGNYCSGGTCVPCVVDNHCGVACVQCVGTTPYCSSTGAACVECKIDSHCQAGEYCNDGKCASCNTDQHCGSDCKACAPQLFCNGVSCVGCCGPSCLICQPGQYCHNNACAPCDTNDHCGSSCVACTGSKPFCKGGSTCVECLYSSQCPTGTYCKNNSCEPCDLQTHCGPTCVACGASETCCGTSIGCADLMTDKQNCGVCGKACSTFCNIGLCDASVKCSTTLTKDIYSTPAVDDAGNVYVATTDGKVTSVKPDCSPRWTFPIGHYTSASPVLSPDGKTVYVSSTAGPAAIYALNAATGAKKWSFTISDGWSAYNTPAVAADGTVYAIGNKYASGSYQETLYALDPAGGEKWRYYLVALGSSSNNGGPAIGSDGTVYALTTKGVLVAVSAIGSKKWSVDLGCCVTDFSIAIGTDGNVYAAAGKTLYKLNAATGAIMWSKVNTITLSHVGVVVGGTGRAFLTTPGGQITAYESSGSVAWSLPASGKYNSVMAMGSDGILYAINGSNGSLKAMNPQSGATLWSMQVGNAFVSSPTISSSGILWVGTGSKLWAVTTGAVTGLSTKGWPKRHKDARNSGQR